MTHDSPSKTFASAFRKPSVWDVVYSINMGVACVIAYAITTSILVPATARDDDLLGAMWAAAAAAFVFRDTRAHSLSAGLARFIATCVSFVPLSWFRQRPDGPQPDLSDVAVTDFGQTVRLGEYEAATDAILYGFDDDYRRRAKKRQLETDRSLGGALRRLRLQKGIRQSDFPGVTAKEIARIERGEVKRPHQHTLAAIANRLDVATEDISTY